MSAFLILSACQGVKESGETGIGPTVSPIEQEASTVKAPIILPTPTTERPPPSDPTLTPIVEVVERASPFPTMEPETPAPTATNPPPEFPVRSISLVQAASGFERPTYLTHARDSRLFVVEQAGLIWIVLDGKKSSEPFLDITDRVNSIAFERGLLSLAFHPNYLENRTFFVYYTDLQGNVVVSRFWVDADNHNVALQDSEEILLTINEPYGNHNGGQLQFGPDGMLYIGVGDGGSAGDPQNHGQNPATLLGSILRIDIDKAQGYDIPTDNPYAKSDIVSRETWAFGLRNPWRFSFDRQSGDLLLADVGQSNWEEVNFQSAGSSGGQNYGWNITEGFHCYGAIDCDYNDLTLPVFEYSHVEGGCSITGGYVYRGESFPELNGSYFFGDYCSGFIWSLLDDIGGVWVSNLVHQSGLNISSFGEDVNGEIYVLDHTYGRIYQIQP